MKQLILSTSMVLALASGCVKYTTAPENATPLNEDQKRFAATWQAAQQVLTDYRFEIDRVDARQGIIVTKPMVTAAPFEFWRDDVKTTSARLQSALYKTHAMAIVTISAQPDSQTGYRPYTRVLFARSSKQPTQMTSAAAVAMVYTGRGVLVDYGETETETQLEQAPQSDMGEAEKTDQPAVSAKPTQPAQTESHPEMPTEEDLGRLSDFEARIDQAIRQRAAELYAESD